jgi:hypothetical protein
MTTKTHTWKLTPQSYQSTASEQKLMTSPPFNITNENGELYTWEIEIYEDILDGKRSIRPYLFYKKGPQKEIFCAYAFRIVGNGSIAINYRDSREFVENGTGYGLIGGECVLALDQQYRANIGIAAIEISVDISLPAQVF